MPDDNSRAGPGLPASTSPDAAVNLPLRSRISNLKRPARSASVHEQVAGLLTGPPSGGCAVTAAICTRRVSIQHGQDLQPPEEHGARIQQIGRDTVPAAGTARHCRQVGDPAAARA